MNKNSIIFGAYCGACCILGVILGKMETKYACKVAYAKGQRAGLRDFYKEKQNELKALEKEDKES